MTKVYRKIQKTALDSWIDMFSKNTAPSFEYYVEKFNKKTGKDLVQVLESMPYAQREVVLQCIVAAYGLGHETSRAFFTRNRKDAA